MVPLRGRPRTPFVPPASVAKLDDITPGGIKLGEDAAQASAGVVKARRELEEETSHARAEQIGDVTEVLGSACVVPVNRLI